MNAYSLSVKQLHFVLLVILLSISHNQNCVADTNDYSLIKSTNELYNGCKVVVVNKNFQKAMTGEATTNNTRLSGTDITLNGDRATIPNNAVEWTLQYEQDGYWYFYNEGIGYLNNATTKKNNTYTEAININSSKTNSCRCSISISSTGRTEIVFDKNYSRYLYYTGYTFGCKDTYTNVSQEIYLYKPVSSKIKTYISFDNNNQKEYYIKEGDEASFISPKAKLYLSESNTLINDADIVYNSSNTNIATIDNMGNITMNSNKTFGTTTITANFAGNDQYLNCTESYKINYTPKSKTPTSLAFEEDIDKQLVTVKYGNEDEFKGAVATLTPNSTTGIVSYKSSNENVVKVDQNGILKYTGFGKATITATFAGDDKYEKSSTYYKLEYIREQIIFSSSTNSFKDLQRDGYYSGKQGFYDQNGNNYAFIINNGKLTRIENGIFQLKSDATSPEIVAPNGYIVTVDYYQDYNSSGTSSIMKIKGTNYISSTNQTFTKIDTPNQTSGIGYRVKAELPTTSTFTIVPGNLAYISRIQIDINPIPNITLKDTEDNSSILINNDGKIANVQLERTLLADKWNTLCVPFDITLELGKLCGVETIVREYDHMDENVMRFKTTNNIVAGRPYLVKPINNDIENPSFDEIVINNTNLEKSGEDYFYMIGTYSPVDFDEELSKLSLFLNAQAQFMQPTANSKIKGMRAYFVTQSPEQANAMQVGFTDDGSGIEDIENYTHNNNKIRIYNLNGYFIGNDIIKLSKGIYIINGKKVIR